MGRAGAVTSQPMRAPDRPAPLAFGLMIAAMVLIPLGDSAGRVLTGGMGGVETVGSGFVAWSRFALAALVLLLAMPGGMRAEALRLMADGRVWLRGALLAGTIWAVLTALGRAEMATVFGAFFVGPMLSAALAVVLLGERMGRGQALCLLAGFGGVLMVLRPWQGAGLLDGLEPGVGFGLLAGLCYGAFLTASRWLAGRARPLPLLWSQFAVGALLLAPVGVVAWPATLASDGRVAALTAASAAASLAGNLALLLAYRRAGAARLAPLVYVQLVAATALGWLLFAEWPEPWVLGGLGVVIAAGVGGWLLVPAERGRVEPGAGVRGRGRAWWRGG